MYNPEGGWWHLFVQLFTMGHSDQHQQLFHLLWVLTESINICAHVQAGGGEK